jgi:F-type H+-transporting ATPase subunit epsilon
MPTMKLEIVTAERVVYSDEVEVVVAPGIEGELGILPHHAPLLTVLKPGELRVVKDGQEEIMAVSGGFLEVLGNTVTVLADTAEHAEEINEARAQEAVRHAQERLAAHTSDLDLGQAIKALQRAQVRVNVARRRRPRGMGEAPPSTGGR